MGIKIVTRTDGRARVQTCHAHIYHSCVRANTFLCDLFVSSSESSFSSHRWCQLPSNQAIRGRLLPWQHGRGIIIMERIEMKGGTERKRGREREPCQWRVVRWEDDLWVGGRREGSWMQRMENERQLTLRSVWHCSNRSGLVPDGNVTMCSSCLQSHSKADADTAAQRGAGVQRAGGEPPQVS